MTQQFTGKVALVTGGGSGIGRGIAQAFAGEGAIAVVSGRREETLAQTVRQITADGGQATGISADVTKPDDVARLVDTVAEKFGRLDIAVNNAGVFAGGPAAQIGDDDWSTVVDVNLTGVWLSMKHEIAHMAGAGGGAIVNIASTIGAHVTYPGTAAYAASKAGVTALTRAAAQDYIGQGIRINAVSPGATDTPMSLQPGETEADREVRLKSDLPIGRVAGISEVAAAVLWLASPQASYMVGHDLVIDGGAAA